MSTVVISSGVTSSGLVVASGGSVEVHSGGTADDTIIDSGGRIDVGGVADVSGVDVGFRGGVTNDTVVQNGGFEYVQSGGMALDTNVTSGGYEEVALSGVASGTVVAAGGMAYAETEGVLSSTIVRSGGTQVVFSAGSAIGAVVSSGGEQIVLSGGMASATHLLSGGVIDEAGFAYAAGGTATLNAATDVLTVSEGGSAYTQTLSGTYAGGFFHIASDGDGGTDITVNGTPCYCRGTLILTPTGQVAVEALRVGDAVELFDGSRAAVRWIGHRTLDLRRHHRPEAAQPVLIEAGALGRRLPRRDLSVSPDHALFIDGHLIPAKALINGFSIRQVWRDSVTYYHVELPAHAIMVAEGAGAESYLETGNRGTFENGATALQLHPEFPQSLREAAGCAPFVEAGPVVEAVRRRLLELAAIPTTDDPGLAIRLEAGAAIIETRTFIPGELSADPRDRLRLGVKIGAMSAGDRDIPLDHALLTEGWHALEPEGRWTDGAAIIPAVLLSGATLKITLAATGHYPVNRDKQSNFIASAQK